MKPELEILIREKFEEVSESNNLTYYDMSNTMFGYISALYDTKLITDEEYIKALWNLEGWYRLMMKPTWYHDGHGRGFC